MFETFTIVIQTTLSSLNSKLKKAMELEDEK